MTPERASVLSLETQLATLILRLSQGVPERLGVIPVDFIHIVIPGVPQHRLLGLSQHFRHAGVNEGGDSLSIDHPYAFLRGFDDAPILLFTLSQGLLGLYLLGHIPLRTHVGDHISVVVPQRSDVMQAIEEAAVLAAIQQLLVDTPPCHQITVDLWMNRLCIGLGVQNLRTLATQVFKTVTIKPGEGFVDIGNVKFIIGQQNGIRRLAHHLRQSHPFLLGRFAFCHIHHDADKTHRTPILNQHTGDIMQPDGAAVSRNHPVVKVVILPLIQHRLTEGGRPLTILRMQMIDPEIITNHPFGYRVTKQFFCFGADKTETVSLGIRSKQDRIARLYQHTVLSLLIPQAYLKLFLPRDVRHSGENDPSTAILHATGIDQNMQFSAVLADVSRLEAGTLTLCHPQPFGFKVL